MIWFDAVCFVIGCIAVGIGGLIRTTRSEWARRAVVAIGWAIVLIGGLVVIPGDLRGTARTKIEDGNYAVQAYTIEGSRFMAIAWRFGQGKPGRFYALPAEMVVEEPATGKTTGMGTLEVKSAGGFRRMTFYMNPRRGKM